MSQPKNTITLNTAEKWAKKWQKQEGNYNSHHELKAMLIPLEDITQLLDQGVDAVRAYLGVDDTETERFMLVGTKYDAATDTYVDMTPDKVVNRGDIYDFTRPCPPSCDTNSPLYNPQ